MTEDERTYQREYARTEKRKAVRRRYNQSEKGKANNNAQCKRWREQNRDKYLASLKKADLKRHYGLTQEQWNKLFTDQGSKCAACRSTDPKVKTGKWSTDHCHTTGKVRGILCNGCNTALGHAEDKPATLRALASYLEGGLTWDRSS
jgi:hypothetical protein